MGSFGGFYKGDKKKPKQNKNKSASMSGSSAPIFTMPRMVEKKKKSA